MAHRMLLCSHRWFSYVPFMVWLSAVFISNYRLRIAALAQIHLLFNRSETVFTKDATGLIIAGAV